MRYWAGRRGRALGLATVVWLWTAPGGADEIWVTPARATLMVAVGMAAPTPSRAQGTLEERARLEVRVTGLSRPVVAEYLAGWLPSTPSSSSARVAPGNW